jgi:hypothetical protein
MHRLETSHYLNENAPDFLLTEGSLVLLMLGYLLEKIPIIRVFHHNTKKVYKYIFFGSLPQRLRGSVYKSLFILHNVVALQRCQDPHLVNGIFLLFIREMM